MEYLPPYSVRLCLGSSLVSDLISRIPEACWRGLQVASHFQHLVWYIRYLNSSLPWKTSAKMGVIQTSFLMVNLTEGCWITSTTTSSIWDHSRAIELAMQIWRQIWFPWAHTMSEWALKRTNDLPICNTIFILYSSSANYFFLSLQPPHWHYVSMSLVHLTIIQWSSQFPGPTTSEAAVRWQPSSSSLEHCLKWKDLQKANKIKKRESTSSKPLQTNKSPDFRHPEDIRWPTPYKWIWGNRGANPKSGDCELPQVKPSLNWVDRKCARKGKWHDR